MRTARHCRGRIFTAADRLWHVQSACDPDWTKWRACDPTSPHWYTPQTFERLVAAYIRQDREKSRQRPLREFLALFDGLSSTSRRSQVLNAVGLARAALDDLAQNSTPDSERIAALLLAMQDATKPVKPARLGIIGEANLRQRFERLGAIHAFKYARIAGTDEDGFPYVVEGAFGYDDNEDARGRQLFCGVNFGSSPSLTFAMNYRSAREILESRYAGADDPITVFLHIAHPRLDFTDLGKTRLSLNGALGDSVSSILEKITAEWTKQRQREMRNAQAALRRKAALERTRSASVKDIVYRHLPDVYAVVSGGVAARSRQLFYPLRDRILAENPEARFSDQYIQYGLIPDFVSENPELCARWVILYDDRGHLIEPHTRKSVGLGTRNVRNYLGSWWGPMIAACELAPPEVITSGPSGRFGAILYCEKEGFTELFETAGLPARFDLALASTKGTSVTAARELFEKAGRLGIPIFALHDFDYAGFQIAATLSRDTRRYRFKHPPEIIDIGLRLADIEWFNLSSEPVVYEQDKDALRRNLRKNGATEAEITFLINGKKRVELNALTTPQLIELIETALVEHGVQKVVPDAKTLAEAYRKEIEHKKARAAIEEAIRKAREEVGEIAIPEDLAEQVADYIEDNPTHPWDAAIRAIAGGAA
jgi:hypothetical protein